MLPPGGLTVALSRVARLVVAARVARSVRHTQAAEADVVVGGGSEDGGWEGSGQGGAPPPAGPTNGAADAGGRPRPSQRPPPKGMGGGGLPPVLLPLQPPGSLACCSALPCDLRLVEAAALYGISTACPDADRLSGCGLLLAAGLLLCRYVLSWLAP